MFDFLYRASRNRPVLLLLLAPLAALLALCSLARSGRHARSTPPASQRIRIRPYLPAPEPPPAPEVEPSVALVRPYLIAAERQAEQKHAEQTRSGLDPRRNIAESQTLRNHPQDDDMEDLAAAVRAYLTTTAVRT